MFGCKLALPVDWVFSTPSVEKRTMDHWTGDMMEERQSLHKYERSTKQKSVAEQADVQTLDTKYKGRMFSLVF